MKRIAMLDHLVDRVPLQLSLGIFFHQLKLHGFEIDQRLERSRSKAQAVASRYHLQIVVA